MMDVVELRAEDCLLLRIINTFTFVTINSLRENVLYLLCFELQFEDYYLYSKFLF